MKYHMKFNSLMIYTVVLLLLTLSAIARENEYSPDELIVKLSANTDKKTRFGKQQGIAATGVSAIDAINRKYHIQSIRPLYKFKPKNAYLDEKYGLSVGNIL